MNWKGFRKKRSWTNHYTISAFALKDRVKLRKTSVRKADAPAEIRTEHVPKTSRKCYRNVNPVGIFIVD
jgi:hypothetical protein